jgi:ActR/RegA family two-component response regulator
LPSLIPTWSARSTILMVDDDPFLAHPRKSMLERRFAVERATDAAQAFILLQDRAFTDRLSLIVVALRQPGFSGPAFVRELTDRLPRTPVLVIGAPGEIAPDYGGNLVRFLPRQASCEDLLAGACDMIFGTPSRVA